MSQEFALSFLSACFDAGLSKEAAAELLQKESVDQELYDRPAFAEGYLSVTAGVPGQMLPLRAGYEGLEKLAARIPTTVLGGLGGFAKNILWDAPMNLLGALRGAGSGAASAVGKANKSKFLHKYPFPSAVGAATLTGAGVYGANKWINRDRDLMPSRPTPFFGPSGYSPQGYKDHYENELDRFTPGIYDHNKEQFGDEDRRKELEEAVASGKGGDAAYLELQERNRDHASSTSSRKRHLDSLENYQSENRGLVDRLTDRTADLENQRTAWWAAPKRWALSMTGQNPREYYDRKIADLQGVRSNAQTEADLAKDRQRLIWSGATQDVERKQPTTQELQQKFFPRY